VSKFRIVVTGGAGFIASHVVDTYLAAGHRVAVIDNLSTGSRRNLNPRATFYHTDICDPKKVAVIFKKERPQVVNHHAAQVSVVESVREPLLAVRTNVLGTTNLLQAFTRYGARNGKFIFASTGGAIYGNPTRIPVSETIPPHPLSPYALSKMLAEGVVRFYGEEHGLRYMILRYSNVFGPRQDPHGEAGVVAIFIGLLRRGARPTIFGDGSKTRDYVYVGDVVRANLLALTRGKNETVNVSRGEEVKDARVFETIARALHSNVPVKYAPFRPGEVRRISLSPQRAKRVLGWEPKADFARGIREIVRTL